MLKSNPDFIFNNADLNELINYSEIAGEKYTHVFTFDCEFFTFVRFIQIISPHYNLNGFSELDEVTPSKKNCHIMFNNFEEEKIDLANDKYI